MFYHMASRPAICKPKCRNNKTIKTGEILKQQHNDKMCFNHFVNVNKRYPNTCSNNNNNKNELFPPKATLYTVYATINDHTQRNTYTRTHTPTIHKTQAATKSRSFLFLKIQVNVDSLKTAHTHTE